MMRRGATRLVLFASALVLLAHSEYAWASSGCDAVNVGGWNQGLAAGNNGNAINGFQPGDQLFFSLLGLGPFQLREGGNVVLTFTAPTTTSGSYTIPADGTYQTRNNGGGIQAFIVTATCTPAVPVPSGADASQSLTKGFLVSRINGLLLNEPGSTSLLHRSIGTSGSTSTASLGNATNVATSGGVFGSAMALGRHLGDGDEADVNGAGSQSIEFRTSLSQMRREAAAARDEKYRMALGAGDGGALPLAHETASPWDIWAEGRYSAFDDDAGNLDRKGHVGVLYLGGDYRVTPDMIIGGLVQFDWSKDDSTVIASKVDGNGWMTGPYLSARVHENVYLDLRAAWGRSSNDMALGTTAGAFNTSRWLVKGTLAGNWLHDAWRITPSAVLAYAKESADAFTNSAGTFVPGQDVSLGRLQFGTEVGYRFARTADMFLEPFAAIRGVWDFDNPNVAINGFVVGPGDFWGRLEGGLTVLTAGGIAVRGSASWDGVGASNYSGYTLQGNVKVRLN
jgi:outer membrane autotransporter protein